MLLAGCADDRAPLEECTYARYWADCTGNAETTADPVVGCDGATGECRWFRGGVTARDHAVSDCPPGAVCCHDGSPFTDWAPGGDVQDLARTDVGLLSRGVLGPDGAHDVPVVVDHVGAIDRARVTCSSAASPAGIPCAFSALYWRDVQQVGDAILVSIRGTNPLLQIEIYPAGGTERRARVYAVYRAATIDGPVPASALCHIGWGGFVVDLGAGMLHLNDDLSDLHGRLDGTYGVATFTIEF